MTAAPPNECPTSRRTSRPESFMKRAACAVSASLWENEPSPQSPSESPSPRLSKRSIPIPSLASCLQIRLAAGLSLPSVKPCENTPQPLVGPSGRSISPASRGPLVLENQTRSLTSHILADRPASRDRAMGTQTPRCLSVQGGELEPEQAALLLVPTEPGGELELTPRLVGPAESGQQL